MRVREDAEVPLFSGLAYQLSIPFFLCVYFQMLQAVANLAPRGVYVCGNTTSAAGLTVRWIMNY